MRSKCATRGMPTRCGSVYEVVARVNSRDLPRCRPMPIQCRRSHADNTNRAAHQGTAAIIPPGCSGHQPMHMLCWGKRPRLGTTKPTQTGRPLSLCAHKTTGCSRARQPRGSDALHAVPGTRTHWPQPHASASCPQAWLCCSTHGRTDCSCKRPNTVSRALQARLCRARRHTGCSHERQPALQPLAGPRRRACSAILRLRPWRLTAAKHGN